MPVDNHLEMLSAQRLASFLRPSNLSNAVVTAPSGPRRQKETLQSKFSTTVYPFPGLILERAREPDAVCFALGLSYFESSEPGRLCFIEMEWKRSDGVKRFTFWVIFEHFS